MEISTEMVKELRSQCGAGIMECRSALISAEGDTAKALQILKERWFLKAEKRADRATTQGLIAAYIHAGGRLGAMVEVKCESDFVARTDEFKQLAHSLAMQVAAMSPKCISAEELPSSSAPDLKTTCLLEQSYIKDPNQTVSDIIIETIAKVGENIKVTRFARFELGE